MSLWLSWEPEKTAVDMTQSPPKGRKVDSSVSSGWEVGRLLLGGN